LDPVSDPEPDPDPLVRDTDPGIWIRIRTKMSRISNTFLLYITMHYSSVRNPHALKGFKLQRESEFIAVKMSCFELTGPNVSVVDPDPHLFGSPFSGSKVEQN
jgi:hypothetical protein